MLSTVPTAHDTHDREVLQGLRDLRVFAGPEGEFWLSFAERGTRLLHADWGVFLRKSNEAWHTFCFQPLVGQPKQGNLDPQQLDDLAQKILQEGIIYFLLQSRSDRKAAQMVLGIRLETGEADEQVIALFGRGPWQNIERQQDLLKLEFILDVPASYRTYRTLRRTREELDSVSEPLDLMLCINEHQRYLGAAMALCNEMAARYGCSRVSLGWARHGYVRVQTVSHMDRFDQKMDAVQALEAAMEECLDQDEEILLPEPEKATTVTRDHQKFASRYGQPAMISLPLRLDQRGVGVLTCEREKPFSEQDVRGLRIACDQVVRRLGDLKRYDRWFGARLADSLRSWIGGLLGVEYTWAKVIGMLMSLMLAFLLFGTMEYKVEAPFILRTKDLAFLCAPFDGYIEKVTRSPGDVVEQGERLLVLDTRELRLEESRAVADLQRYMREEEKARAKNALAEMQVAEALKKQAETRLEMIRYHLDYAEIKTPFAGVVVEGELEKLLGAPVRKGDVLLKVAMLENLYVEMKVSERDIHEVGEGLDGEIAFISRPDSKYTVTVERIEPMAVTEERGNVFLVRGRLSGDKAGWWRPGMSGLAKIHIGERWILWVLLHRTIDVLRMTFWW